MKFSRILRTVDLRNLDYAKQLVKYFNNIKLRIKSMYDVDKFVDELAPNIIELYIGHITITDDILKSLINLTTLDLGYIDTITDLELKYFINLTNLNLNDDITDIALKNLINLTDLKLNNKITNNGIKHLINLTNLNLCANNTITDMGLQNLINMTELNIGKNNKTIS